MASEILPFVVCCAKVFIGSCMKIFSRVEEEEPINVAKVKPGARGNPWLPLVLSLH